MTEQRTTNSLVDRLRYHADSRPGGICEEAANEIERLLQTDRLKTREINVLTVENRNALALLREVLEVERNWVDGVMLNGEFVDRIERAVRGELPTDETGEGQP